MIEVDLPARLYLLGLHGVSRVVTHTNRSVMVSIGKRRVLRIHAGYAYASDGVLRAIIRFLDPRLPRAVRRAAERELLERFGTLEKMLAAGRFAAQKDKLLLYKSIATMDKAAPLPPLRNQKPTWVKAAKLARGWKLNRLADRLDGLAAA